MEPVPFGNAYREARANPNSPHTAALRAALPRGRARIFWSYQVLFWLAILLTLLGFNRALKLADATGFALVLRVATGFVISTLVYQLFERPRLRGLPRWVRWPLMVVVAGAGLAASMLLLWTGVMGGPADWNVEQMLWTLPPRLIATGFWCAGIFGLEVVQDLYEARIRIAETDAAAIDVELRMLKAEAIARSFEVRRLQEQMNPHFLFNALNAVVASKHDPEAVESVTRDLADFLRFTLGEARTFEPLSRELQALEKYLAVQQARFGENLVCRIACDRPAHTALVPPMLIQPLLENALHYGMKTTSMPLRVEVTAKVVEDRLEVVVANSGRWVPPDTTRSPSTGIRTLRKRLALLMGDDATVDTMIEPDVDGGWIRVVIRMPVTLSQPPASAEPTRATEPVA